MRRYQGLDHIKDWICVLLEKTMDMEREQERMKRKRGPTYTNMWR